MRNAIKAAVSNNDVVVLPAGAYSLTQADLVLPAGNDIAIVGAGANATTVNAAPRFKVFTVNSPTPGSTISGVTIAGGNPAAGAGGGGMFVSSGYLTLDKSVVTNNQAPLGGGILIGSGRLTLTNSTVGPGNTATGNVPNGGGIYLDSTSTLIAANDTIDGNQAGFGASNPGHGGGLFVNTGATAVIGNVTLSFNTVIRAGSDGGNLEVAGTGTATLANTIVSDGTTNPTGVGTNPNNCGALANGVSSLGHNLESGTDCNLRGTRDIQARSPQLAALALNAPGTTPTRAIALSSPAAAAGDNSRCQPADQRGTPRPLVGGTCDIGAFQVSGVGAAPGGGAGGGAGGGLPGGTPESAEFKIKKVVAVKKNGDLVFDLEAPGKGKFDLRATFLRKGKKKGKKKRKKKSAKFALGTAGQTSTVTYGTADVTAEHAGTVQATIHPTRAGRNALKQTRRLPVAVRVGFRSVGGTSSTKDTKVSVKGKKRKH